jgi:hypothetical protein
MWARAVDMLAAAVQLPADALSRSALEPAPEATARAAASAQIPDATNFTLTTNPCPP